MNDISLSNIMFNIEPAFVDKLPILVAKKKTEERGQGTSSNFPPAPLKVLIFGI